MAWFAAELQPLLAIAAAAVGEDGALIEANAGFIELVGLEGRHPIGSLVSQCFIQPDFATLRRANGGVVGEIYHGLLTMGDPQARTSSLRGRVWRVGGQLRLLAEYDIAELERLSATVLELNHEYADAQIKLAQANIRLQQREAEIVALSLTDPLTGLGNRRRLDQALELETSRADRTGGAFCVLMADLDHFKRINDVWGHEAGDKVLAAFGQVLRQQTRVSDVAARFGGEEFVVVMPHTGLEHALGSAERIREALASVRLEPLTEPVTVSVGVAELIAGERGEALLRRADKALYQAKQSGRDRVVASAIGDVHGRALGAGVVPQP